MGCRRRVTSCSASGILVCALGKNINPAWVQVFVSKASTPVPAPSSRFRCHPHPFKVTPFPHPQNNTLPTENRTRSRSRSSNRATFRINWYGRDCTANSPTLHSAYHVGNFDLPLLKPPSTPLRRNTWSLFTLTFFPAVLPSLRYTNSRLQSSSSPHHPAQKDFSNVDKGAERRIVEMKCNVGGTRDSFRRCRASILYIL